MGIVFRNLSVGSFSLEKRECDLDSEPVPQIKLTDLSWASKVEWPFDESVFSVDVYEIGMVMLSLW